MLHYRVCSEDKYLIVLSPTAPNASYEDIDLNVVVEYNGPQLINSSVPLLFRYAGNPDINAISPKGIRNRFVCFILPTVCNMWYGYATDCSLLLYNFLPIESQARGSAALY